MGKLLPQSIGWYGKLPTRGDFVGRGLPRRWLRTWDDWLQRGLATAALRLGAERLRECLGLMPPWQGVVLPMRRGQPVWCGVIEPSADRVGRVFPLLLAEAYDESMLAEISLVQVQARALYLADWLDRVGVLSTPKDFEAGAARLAATPWDATPMATQGAATLGDLRTAWPAAVSFWWRPEPVGVMQAPLVEGWPPRESLLLDWLGPTAGAQGFASSSSCPGRSPGGAGGNEDADWAS